MDKPVRTQLSIDITPQLRKLVKDAAYRRNISINRLVRRWIVEALKREVDIKIDEK